MTEPKPTYSANDPSAALQAEILKFTAALKALGVDLHFMKLYGAHADVCMVLPGVKWDDIRIIIAENDS